MGGFCCQGCYAIIVIAPFVGVLQDSVSDEMSNTNINGKGVSVWFQAEIQVAVVGLRLH